MQAKVAYSLIIIHVVKSKLNNADDMKMSVCEVVIMQFLTHMMHSSESSRFCAEGSRLTNQALAGL